MLQQVSRDNRTILQHHLSHYSSHFGTSGARPISAPSEKSIAKTVPKCSMSRFSMCHGMRSWALQGTRRRTCAAQFLAVPVWLYPRIQERFRYVFSHLTVFPVLWSETRSPCFPRWGDSGGWGGKDDGWGGKGGWGKDDGWGKGGWGKGTQRGCEQQRFRQL